MRTFLVYFVSKDTAQILQQGGTIFQHFDIFKLSFIFKKECYLVQSKVSSFEVVLMLFIFKKHSQMVTIKTFVNHYVKVEHMKFLTTPWHHYTVTTQVPCRNGQIGPLMYLRCYPGVAAWLFLEQYTYSSETVYLLLCITTVVTVQ